VTPVIHDSYSVDVAILLGVYADIFGRDDGTRGFESDIASREMSFTPEFCIPELPFQGNETSHVFDTSELSASAIPPILPSTSTGSEYMIGNLLPPSLIEEECPIPALSDTEEPYSSVCPSVEEWKEEWMSESTGASSSTSLHMQESSAASPLGAPLLSCSSNSTCHRYEQVLNLLRCSLLKEEIECARSLCRCRCRPVESHECRVDFGKIVKKSPSIYCKKCYTSFTRQPDLNRHMRGYSCGGQRVPCQVCKKLLCRKDAVMRHLLRKDGRNRCSMLLEEKQISKEAVASGRITRGEIGTDKEIEAALKRYGDSKIGI
jgi:hypothetical protein